MSACFSRPGFIALPNASTRRRMASSALSSRTSSTPAARAAAAAVRSSVVGPRPPVTMTRRVRGREPADRADDGVDACPARSPCAPTLKPAAVSSAASHEALVLTISPRVSSVPIESKATVMGAAKCSRSGAALRATIRPHPPAHPTGGGRGPRAAEADLRGAGARGHDAALPGPEGARPRRRRTSRRAPRAASRRRAGRPLGDVAGEIEHALGRGAVRVRARELGPRRPPAARAGARPQAARRHTAPVSPQG